MIGGDIIFSLAVRSVRLHVLRSVLAALGIVIGVVAIASMGMMGTNMTLSITADLTEMANVIVVTPSTGGGGGWFMGHGGGGSSDGEDYLDREQFKDLVRIAGKYGSVYALYQESDEIKVGSTTGRATIYGIDTDILPDILTIADGQYPTSTSSVLIGPTLAERYDLVPGSRLNIGDPDEGGTTKVRVVGILEERGMSMDLNSDNAIIAGEKLFLGMYGGEDEYTQVNIVLDDIDDVQYIKKEIDDQMNRKEDEVSVQDSSRMLETMTSTLSTLTTFVMAIAGISLLVAATSIFNVMMMSVTERINEIGIMRSIGTQRGEVRWMFLYEAGILGAVGAVIGAVLSLAFGYFFVLAMVGTTEYFFTAESLVYVPTAMIVGTVICILSGVYPAWHASNLDPIEALRAE